MKPGRLQNAIRDLEGVPLESLVAWSFDKTQPPQRRRACVWHVMASDLAATEKSQFAAECLDDPDMMVQRIAVSLCVELDGPALLDKLKRIAASGGVNRIYALRCLAQHGESAVLGYCREFLSEASQQERCELATVLGLLGTEEATELLQEMFASGGSRRVRTFAALGLARLATIDALVFMEKRLARSRGTERPLIAAALAVNRRKPGLVEVGALLKRGKGKQVMMLRQCLRSYGLKEVDAEDWECRTRQWLEREIGTLA